jgi:hypothetical protein
MRRAAISTVLAVFALAACFSLRSLWACGDEKELLLMFAKNAVSEDPKAAEAAIRTLRNQGPEGLQALLAAHADEIKKHTAQMTTEAVGALKSLKPDDADEKTWQRIRTALDEVSGQHDCHASRLFWYTDLERAKAAAKREGKPILSLRLLGKLTDEFSCANSRFFRTTLYSNAEISKTLGERFILHWKSVRTVPKVTIDFGDGRKLERTLTGNSIHYVLDSDGQAIDALPGLYGPGAFLRELDRAEEIAKKSSGMSLLNRRMFLADYHRDRAAAIEAAWREDLTKLGIAAAAVESKQAGAAANAPATAAAAGRIAGPKYVVERPILKAAALSPTAELAQATTEEVWNRIAQLHEGDSLLDTASLNLIRSQHPTAAALRAITKAPVEDPLLRLVRALQGSIALDTVRNEYTLHQQIHEWLASGNVPELDVFNERVYAELFLTPSSDPWLGLLPADTFTALENNGVTWVAAKK